MQLRVKPTPGQQFAVGPLVGQLHVPDLRVGDTPLEAYKQLMGQFYMVPAVGVLFLIWVVLFVPWEVAVWKCENPNQRLRNRYRD
jgi:hypothetical protein